MSLLNFQTVLFFMNIWMYVFSIGTFVHQINTVIQGSSSHTSGNVVVHHVNGVSGTTGQIPSLNHNPSSVPHIKEFGDTFSNCCPATQCASCNKSDPFISKYRTYDGTCNNYLHPTWGAINTPLNRLIPAEYADGKDKPRGFPSVPSFKLTLPPPNSISEDLFGIEVGNTGVDVKLSVLFMTFGQFLDHDMGISPHDRCELKQDGVVISNGGIQISSIHTIFQSTKAICRSTKSFVYPCFPIQFTDPKRECTPFGRSIPICQNVERKEQRTVREQANALTAFIDGSQIYGETIKKQQSLRKFDGTGCMKLTDNKLPIETTTNGVTCKTKGGCSLVGDVRGDENMALHAMHTVWVREHNRIATQLEKLNSTLEEEEIFQLARKINVAQFQHVVYNEFLPNIIILPNWSNYSQNVNPSIANAFSTAAFRFGHGMIPNSFAQLDNKYNQLRPPLKLQEVFFNRQSINSFGIESIMYGLLDKQARKVDTAFSDSISRRLFVPPGQTRHMDLTAFNIQRGRDHGLPTYGKWRQYCGLSVPTEWSHLDDIMFEGAGAKFQAVYTSSAYKNLNPGDIDLFVAGMAEKHVGNLQVGPTFSCIIKDQFQRLRDGDRFYYENPGQFTSLQLNAIKKVTMASILCQNLNGIKTIQMNAFKHVSGQLRIACNAVPKLDLKEWKNIE